MLKLFALQLTAYLNCAVQNLYCSVLKHLAGLDQSPGPQSAHLLSAQCAQPNTYTALRKIVSQV